MTVQVTYIFVSNWLSLIFSGTIFGPVFKAEVLDFNPHQDKMHVLCLNTFFPWIDESCVFFVYVSKLEFSCYLNYVRRSILWHCLVSEYTSECTLKFSLTLKYSVWTSNCFPLPYFGYFGYCALKKKKKDKRINWFMPVFLHLVLNARLSGF